MSSTRRHRSPDLPADRPQAPADLRPGVDDAPEGAVSRRRVLGVGAGMTAVGLVAACGGGNDSTASPGEGSEPADGATGDPSARATEDSGGAAGPLVATADVPVEGGVILDKQKVVVTQPVEGTFKAFSAICTHQACTVASVKKNVISCPCHGSAFSADDGSVQNGPATRPLPEVPVTVEGDQVVAT